MDHIKMSKYSPERKYPPKAQDPTTVVTTDNKSPPLEGVHSTKNVGMWNLKHKIIPPKLYELLIKTQLKGYTDMDLNKLYNYINMCLNVVTRIREEFLPD